MTYSISRLDTDSRAEWLRRMRYDVEIDGAVVLLDHTPRRPDEISQHKIEMALELGYRGRDSQDLRDIRRVMTVATGEASIDFLYEGAEDIDLSIQLDEMADDACEYIANALGEDYAVFDDGEAGATLVERVGTGADVDSASQEELEAASERLRQAELGNG